MIDHGIETSYRSQAETEGRQCTTRLRSPVSLGPVSNAEDAHRQDAVVSDTEPERAGQIAVQRGNITGLDYAVNRYYSSSLGRLLTPDPYMNGAFPGDPARWNRYSYTGGDPVNRADPGGLMWVCFGNSVDELSLNCPPNAYKYNPLSVDDWDDVHGNGQRIDNPCGTGSMLLPNPWCNVPVITLVAPPPKAADSKKLCEEMETLYIAAYLPSSAGAHSPLTAYAAQIVQEADEFGIDDRFIVALAGVETTYGTRGANSWGTNNVFNNGHQDFSSLGSAIDAVIRLLTTSTNPNYISLHSTREIYGLYEVGDRNKTSGNQGLLDQIYARQLGGSSSDVKFSRCK